MAAVLGAPEVVLLKSRTLPERCTFAQAAEEGFVDPHFPVVAPAVGRVVAVNLRAVNEPPCVLAEEGPVNS
jgi:hypothetical protein